MGTTKGATKKLNRTKEYIIIEQMLNSGYRLTLLCEIAGVPRSGYYKWFNGKLHPSLKQLQDQDLKEKIMVGHQQRRGIFGYPRMQTWLFKTFGIQVIINVFIV